MPALRVQIPQVLHIGDGQFKIYKSSGQTAEMNLDGSGTVKALAVSLNGNAIGIIVEDPPNTGVRYLAISSKSGDGTYGKFLRSPKLPTKTTHLTISKAGLAVCICDQAGPKIRDTSINDVPYPYSGSFSRSTRLTCFCTA